MKHLLLLPVSVNFFRTKFITPFALNLSKSKLYFKSTLYFDDN